MVMKNLLDKYFHEGYKENIALYCYVIKFILRTLHHFLNERIFIVRQKAKTKSFFGHSDINLARVRR